MSLNLAESDWQTGPLAIFVPQIESSDTAWAVKPAHLPGTAGRRHPRVPGNTL